MREGCRRGVLLGLTAASLLTSCDPEPPCARGSAAEIFSATIILPHPSSEDVRGVRIREPAGFLRCIGLRHDDVIVGWNGSAIEDEADSAAMLRALAEAPRFSLQVRDAARNLRTLDYPKPAAPR